MCLSDKNREMINAVILDQVTVKRGGNLILQDISWEASSGKCHAVIGPNGAGKSTLIALIAGYLWPTNGTVTVLGGTYGRVSIQDIRKRIGLVAPSRVPETPWWMKVRDVAASGFFGTIVIPPGEDLTPRQREKVASELEAAGLTGLEDKQFGKLSTGERMRTLLARAMVAGHELLLLDEPTAGLDLGARVAVVKSMEKMIAGDHPPTVIIVSHHLEELPSPLHSALVLKEGKVIAEGDAGKTLTSKNLSEAYNCGVEVNFCDGHWTTTVNSSEWKL